MAEGTDGKIAFLVAQKGVRRLTRSNEVNLPKGEGTIGVKE